MTKWIIYPIFFVGLLACQPQRMARNSADFWDKEDLWDSGDPAERPSPNIPEGARHCNWSPHFSHHHGHLSDEGNGEQGGRFNICQDRTKRDKIFFQIQTPLPGDICFFAVHNRDDRGISLGSGQCLALTRNTTVYPVTLKRDRAGYDNYATNSVVIIRKKKHFYGSPFPRYEKTDSTVAYVTCNRYLEGGRDDYCRVFKEAGHYLQHDF